jgi:hypothetical protein
VKGRCVLNDLGYDYVTRVMIDVVHSMKEFVKKILLVMKGTRKLRPAAPGRPVDGAGLANYLTAHERADRLRRTETQCTRADRKYVNSPVPPGNLRRSVKPFQHTGSMTMNDMHRYIRPQGVGSYHLACTDLPDDLLQILVDGFWAVDLLLRHEVSRSEMQATRQKWVEVMCQLERTLPHPEGQAILNHNFFEIWDQVFDSGPSYTTWMYVFERVMAELTRTVSRAKGSLLLNSYIFVHY